MAYKIGDKVVMGFKKRTFWQWLRDTPREPQVWIVTMAGSGEPGSLSYIEPEN